MDMLSSSACPRQARHALRDRGLPLTTLLMSLEHGKISSSYIQNPCPPPVDKKRAKAVCTSQP